MNAARRITARPSLLQAIDHRVGVPACALLTLVRRFAGLFGGRGPSAPPRKILFVKLAEQGSTVLAHAAICDAIARVGRDSVYFLVFEENRFILDVLGLVPVGNVFALRTRSASTLMTSCVTHLAAIRRCRIDTTIDLEFFARTTAALAFLSGARRRIGFHAAYGDGPYRGDLLTHRVGYNPHLHTSSAFASLVHAVGVEPTSLPTHAFVPPAPEPPPRFDPEPAERQRMRDLLASLGVPAGRRLILLNANAGDLLPQRRWAGENYVVLAQRLLARFPEISVVFTGAPLEADDIASLVGHVGSVNCVSVAGRTTLRELLVCYTLAEVLVTNDSGPAHFAALTPIDTVTLFGPETPRLFAAPGPRSHPLWAGLACSPCVSAGNNRRTSCLDNQCMKAHTVAGVFDVVGRIYAQRVEGKGATCPGAEGAF